MVAAPPPDGTPVPPRVVTIARGHDVVGLWANEVGGLTYRIAPIGVVVKWQPPRPEAWAPDLLDEAARLAWAGRHVTVPRVLDAGADDEGAWLVTEDLAVDNAVTDRWKADPAAAVAAIGTGLRRLHDRLPVDSCPWSWDVDHRLLHLQPGHDRAGFDDRPPVDRLVVCHGDACAPNTLVDDTGTCAGHVDLGTLGLADRWADVAVASMSLGWNFGPGWEPAFFAAYGIDPDEARLDFYRRLWDAT